MGTKVYVDESIEPLQRYSTIIDRYYHADIERLNLKNAQFATNHINNWCSNVTMGSIKQLVTPSDISQSVMIMLNAIYFQGQWRKPFLKNETMQMLFHRTPRDSVKTTFISRTGLYYFLDSMELNAKVLRIPYMGKKFSMLLVLPYTHDGLTEFLRTMDESTLRKAEWLMDDLQVKVTIPKFKFDYSTKLNDVLNEVDLTIIL